MIYQGSARYPVNEIVVHCSATYPSWMSNCTATEKRDEIKRWHVTDRKWRDIGYHKLIDRDGTIVDGRKFTDIGAGVVGHNRGVIHVCLLGGAGSTDTDKFSDHFTPQQDSALRGLIEEIKKQTSIKRISGHNEWAAKACPGFVVPFWINAK